MTKSASKKELTSINMFFSTESKRTFWGDRIST